MSYYQLRLTLPADSSGNSIILYQQILVRFLKVLHKKHDSDIPLHHTGGLERLNGYGEPVPPHFHVHFYYAHPTPVDVTRELKRQIKLIFSKYGIPILRNAGPNSSALTQQDPEDVLRFLRYPLKEFPSKPLTSVPVALQDQFRENLDLSENGIQVPFLTYLAHMAQDERRRAVFANLKHREKSREKSTFKDKLFTHLDQSDLPQSDLVGALGPTHKTIWLAVLAYYAHNDKPINFETIRGYTKLYQLTKHYITPESAYESQN